MSSRGKKNRLKNENELIENALNVVESKQRYSINGVPCQYSDTDIDTILKSSGLLKKDDKCLKSISPREKDSMNKNNNIDLDDNTPGFSLFSWNKK